MINDERIQILEEEVAKLQEEVQILMKTIKLLQGQVSANKIPSSPNYPWPNQPWDPNQPWIRKFLED